MNMLRDIQQATQGNGDMDFRKKHKLSDKKRDGEDSTQTPGEENFKKEYRSTRDVLRDMKPTSIRQ